MAKVLIEVTQADIENGERQTCNLCPVALAARRVGIENVRVGYGSLSYGPEEFGRRVAERPAIVPGKGYAVYMLGSRDDQPNAPETYAPTEEEKEQFEQGQRQAVLDVQDSEERWKP